MVRAVTLIVEHMEVSMNTFPGKTLKLLCLISALLMSISLAWAQGTADQSKEEKQKSKDLEREGDDLNKVPRLNRSSMKGIRLPSLWMIQGRVTTFVSWR